ncbi:MAG: DUF4159 domain-containing protein [Verrucomicrobiota bacterium]
MNHCFLLPASVCLALSLSSAAQSWRQPGIPANRNGVENWTNDPRFPDDTFRFARLRPQFHRKWLSDYPDSDLNFSFRLQQMTAIKVDPNPIVVGVLDPKMKECPFLYMTETGTLNFTQQEAKVLREHLLNGGFLMIDDFWGAEEWRQTEQQMKLLFPDRPIADLELDHPIFNIVFQLKEKPQVPAIEYAMSGRHTGIFYEKGGKNVHYHAIYDDKGRMMVLISRNNDLGDGWEREGEDPYFFTEFSEKKAYPMGINIIVYVMTH